MIIATFPQGRESGNSATSNKQQATSNKQQGWRGALLPVLCCLLLRLGGCALARGLQLRGVEGREEGLQLQTDGVVGRKVLAEVARGLRAAAVVPPDLLLQHHQ